MTPRKKALRVLMSVLLVASGLSFGFLVQTQRQPPVVSPGFRSIMLEDSYEESQRSDSDDGRVRAAVGAYFEAKYSSRVHRKAVDPAFVIDLTAPEGLDLYNYELGLLKYTLACYELTETFITGYKYRPVFEAVEIEDDLASVVACPCVDVTYAHVPDETGHIGTEEHRLTLVRTDARWKVRSDSYSTEITSEYRVGTDFEALLISLPDKYARWMKADKERKPRSTANQLLDSYLTYDRPEASGYAHDHAYSDNGNFAAYGSDCANFVSQCIWYGFGGTDSPTYIDGHELPMVDDISGATEWWGDSSSATLTWNNVPAFLDLIEANFNSDSVGVQGIQGSLYDTIQADTIVWDNPSISGPDDHIYIVCHVDDLNDDGVTQMNEIWVCAHTADRRHALLSDIFGTPERLTFYAIAVFKEP